MSEKNSLQFNNRRTKLGWAWLYTKTQHRKILSNKRLKAPLLRCMVMFILSLVFSIVLSSLSTLVRQGHEISGNYKVILMSKNDANWYVLGDNIFYIEIS